MKPPVLVLASASPRRSALLSLLSIPFEVVAAEVEEVAHAHLAPREICLANAAAKARAVAHRFPNAIILGADTEVALGTRVFGKPQDHREAARFLRALAGRTHQVITGVCLLHRASRFRHSFSETTHVTFHPLDDAQIADYLGRMNPLDKAGAYGIQEAGERIIESIVGSLSNVVGLPVEALRRAMRSLPADLRLAPPR